MSAREIGESVFTYITVRVTTRERLDRLSSATGRNFDETISDLISGSSPNERTPRVRAPSNALAHTGAHRFKIACAACGWSTTTGQTRTAVAALEVHKSSCPVTHPGSRRVGRPLCGSLKTRRDGMEIRCRRYDGHETRPGTERHVWWNWTGQSEEW